ncbi:Uncharacterised protein [Mycobacterium tuberculosis]|nr:Uncharacterised protein [Mycobacterium tuberculosis]
MRVNLVTVRFNIGRHQVKMGMVGVPVGIEQKWLAAETDEIHVAVGQFRELS